jgi:hypothetical protein
METAVKSIDRNTGAAMKLRDARLCINCDTVYAATGLVAQCPACGSGTFSLLTRWVPTMAEIERFTKEIGARCNVPAQEKGTAVVEHERVPTT